MQYQIKKLIFNITLNITFFVILMIAIQNSEQRERVIFFKYQSIALPISFIIGTSFISGSILGNFLIGSNEIRNKK